MSANFMPNSIYIMDNISFLSNVNPETIDLIATDPPFNTRRHFGVSETGFHGQSNLMKSGKFADSWKWGLGVNGVDAKDLLRLEVFNPVCLQYIWTISDKSMRAFIVFLSSRLIEMHRILKPTGSIYVHCDQTASHYIKLAMDAIFGIQNFRNEIVWKYAGGGMPKKAFGRKHDTILFYTKSCDYYYNKLFVPYSETCSGRHSDGSLVNKDRGAGMTACWTDIPALNTQSSERLGYPTQKPMALYERIINASCPPDGIVLDPFMGSGTTLAAAAKNRREWIGCDHSDNTEYVKRNICLQNNLVQVETTPPTLLNRFKPLIQCSLYSWDNCNFELVAPSDGIYKNKRDALYPLVLKDGQNCQGCNQFLPSPRQATVDRKYPESKGGENTLENMQILCSACNREKSDNIWESMDEFRKMMKHSGEWMSDGYIPDNKSIRKPW